MTIETRRFDLDRFLERLEENYGRLGPPVPSTPACDAHSGVVVRVRDFETVESFPDDWRVGDVSAHLADEGAAVFVPFAFGDPEGAFADCTDGVRRRLLARDDLCLGDGDFLGYLITRKGDAYSFSPVEFDAGPGAGTGRPAEVIAVSKGNRYWKAMQAFAHRFERRETE